MPLPNKVCTAFRGFCIKTFWAWRHVPAVMNGCPSYFLSPNQRQQEAIAPLLCFHSLDGAA